MRDQQNIAVLLKHQQETLTKKFYYGKTLETAVGTEASCYKTKDEEPDCRKAAFSKSYVASTRLRGMKEKTDRFGFL